MSLDRAVGLRRRLKGRFVLTNGVFDLLHPGHTSYLARAKKLAGPGGVLFVALNSDASVRALKGPERPILPERARAYNLSQLASVDGIVVFRGKRLASEILRLRPDVYCKAGDYSPSKQDPSERAALAEVGARVRFLPFVKGFSTTRMIARIRRAGGI
jgi:rfaE bifunctional protein nucleotidyltransferase chain/domain